MSKIFLARELVEGTARGHMPAATRRAAWLRDGGCCMWCGEAVPAAGPLVDYDHRAPLALGGADALDNIAPIHRRPCHKEKTLEDIRRIAKAKRQRRMIESPRRSKRPIQGRGFRKDVSRGFNGQVRERT